MKRCIAYIVTGFLLALVMPTAAQAEPLRVVTTTTIIADVARNIGGDFVDVTALIPPDSDVHAFQPTPADAALVAEADVMLVNGAGLEAFLGGLIENAGGVVPVVVSNGVEMLPFGDHEDHADEAEHEEHLGVLGVDAECDAETEHEEETEHEHGGCDPHVWTDPNNVKIWAANIAGALAAADPTNADIYAANAAAYSDQLTALDAEIRDTLAFIPDAKRILVTNHEFLGYFAHAYSFEIAGVVIPGGSTLAETDPQALADLIAVIRDEGAAAIFAEVSAGADLAEVVAQETEINVVTTLYSDSLSAEDGPASTYLDYVRYNAGVIASAFSE